MNIFKIISSKISAVIHILLCLGAVMLFLFFADSAKEGIINGIYDCCFTVIPALFPVTVVCLFLIKGGFLEKLTLKVPFMSVAATFFISMISGYPVGAKIISELFKNKSISKRRAQNMLLYCINSGPAFIVTAVGKNMFGNAKIGILLLISCTLSSIILFIISSAILKDDAVYEAHGSSSVSPFVESVSDAALSMISVGAFVIFFSALASIIESVNCTSVVENLLVSNLEITNAMLYLSENGASLVFIAFLLGFGGICVMLQALFAAKEVGISFVKLFIMRTTHGLLSGFIMMAALKIHPIYMSVFSSTSKVITPQLSSTIPFFISLMILAIGLVLSFKYKNSIDFL